MVEEGVSRPYDPPLDPPLDFTDVSKEDESKHSKHHGAAKDIVVCDMEYFSSSQLLHTYFITV